VHRLLSRWLRSPGHVCVYGWPDHEENSLFAAALLAREPGLRVTLLAERPDEARRYLSVVESLVPAGSVEVVAKNSLRGLVRASASEVLLFTHGLYGSPDLTERKLVINLWHGYGPKANDNAAFAARIRFSALTCNTLAWGRAAAYWLGTPDARILHTGNPRQVAFNRPAPAASLARLGLAPGGFVLWMPTYRSAAGASGRSWRDTDDLAARADVDGCSPVAAVARLAEAAGLQLVVKPHPLDTARYDREGLRVVTTPEIFASGVTLYQFIAASRAMISDYSSAWGEYLGLDRPLILFCPDLAAYDLGRGFSRPLLTEVAPGLIARSAAELRPFFAAVARGKDWRPAHRAAAVARLGIDMRPVHGSAFTAAVLGELRRADAAPPGADRCERQDDPAAARLSNDHSASMGSA
jgi:hypothetical protein